MKSLKIKRQGNKAISIIDLKSIDHLKILVVATSDKILSLYESNSLMNVLNFSLELGGFNMMSYFESYQLLLIAGFENTVKVFTITPEYYELNCVGRLVGHVSIVNAVTSVEGTAMCISCDDKGLVKVWDVRKLSCIQTIQLANKSNINMVVQMKKYNKIIFAGDRLNCMDFEEVDSFAHEREKIVAISCDYNEFNKEIFVVTRKEIRTLDLYTGRVKSIYVNMIDKDKDDEITCFKMIHKKNVFILGNYNGVINMYNATTSELIKRSRPHESTVTCLCLDNYNDMIISSSYDMSIKIQIEKDIVMEQMTKVEEVDEVAEFNSKPILLGEGQHEFNRYKREVLGSIGMSVGNDDMKRMENITLNTIDNISIVRDIINCNERKEITMMEVSIYHNVIATSSSDSRVYLYNYEFFKAIGMIEIETTGEVSMMIFITGYGKLMIGSTNGSIHMFSFQFESLTNLKLKYEMKLSMDSFSALGYDGKSFKLTGYCNRACLDINLVDDPQFENAIIRTDTLNNSKYKMREKNLSLLSIDLLLAESTGVIVKCDLSSYLSKATTYDAFSASANYNPFRNTSENYDNSPLALSTSHLSTKRDKPIRRYEDNKDFQSKSFLAARSTLTHMEILKFDQKLILVSSLDSTVRIFDMNGKMVCHSNLNHPLPIKWNVNTDISNNLKGTILFALKTIELMNQRYHQEEHQHLLSIKDLLNSQIKVSSENTFKITGVEVISKSSKQPPHPLKQSTSLNIGLEQKPMQLINALRSDTDHSKKANTSRKVVLMRDVYIPKDLAYEKIKKDNRDEVQGPTLRQLDYIRRAKNILKLKDPIDDHALSNKVVEKDEPNNNDTAINQLGYFGNVYNNPIRDIEARQERESSLAGKLERKLYKMDHSSIKTERNQDRIDVERIDQIPLPTERSLPTIHNRSKNTQIEGSMSSRRVKSKESSIVQSFSNRNMHKKSVTNQSIASYNHIDIYQYANNRHISYNEDHSIGNKLLDKKKFHELLYHINSKIKMSKYNTVHNSSSHS